MSWVRCGRAVVTTIVSHLERLFRDIATERLRQGVFTSVSELEKAINEYDVPPDLR